MLLAASASSITVSYTAPADNGSVLTGFILEMDSPLNSYGIPSCSSSATIDLIKIPGFRPVFHGDALQFAVTKLARNTQYKFRLVAENSEVGIAMRGKLISYSLFRVRVCPATS